MWSTLQMGITITCACLPTLAPVIPVVAKQLSLVRSRTATVWSRSRSHTRVAPTSVGYKISKDEFEMSRDIEEPVPTHSPYTHGYPGGWAGAAGQGPSAPNMVWVERDVRAAY